MTKTVRFNLNIKEPHELCYYQFHMCTDMKTLDKQTVPKLFNIRTVLFKTRSDCQWMAFNRLYSA